MVLIFARVFTHHTHTHDFKNGQPTRCRAGFRAVCHGLAVLGAAAAVAAALWATEDGTDKPGFHYVAWVGLIVTGIAFVGEILIDDVWPHLKRSQIETEATKPQPNSV
jgi:hypothetical protein